MYLKPRDDSLHLHFSEARNSRLNLVSVVLARVGVFPLLGCDSFVGSVAVYV